MMPRRLLEAVISVLQKTNSFHLRTLWSHTHSAMTKLEWMRLRNYVFETWPDDVFIVTYPRSGTTWVQMMAWQLKSKGSLDFRHIDDVVPWIERCKEADMPRLAALERPRFFKTHCTYEEVPRGARYIYVVRDLKDVAVSLYHHTLFLNDSPITLPAFVQSMVDGSVPAGSWAEHVLPWLEHRNDPNVLLLSYEEMRANPTEALRRIARFSGITLNEAQIPLLVEQSSLETMKKLELKFDPRFARRRPNFIRNGNPGEGLRTLDPNLLAALEVEERRLSSRARKMDPSGGIERWLRYDEAAKS
jgi:hypothetical protein